MRRSFLPVFMYRLQHAMCLMFALTFGTGIALYVSSRHFDSQGWHKLCFSIPFDFAECLTSVVGGAVVQALVLQGIW